MWLGKRTAQSRAARQTDVGLVTIGGDDAGVYTNLEKRQLAAFSPGGYFWLPEKDQNMLLLRAADGENCIAGAEQAQCPQSLKPGEVFIMSAGNAAHLYISNKGNISILGNVTLDGNVSIRGDVSISGTLSVAGGISQNGN